MIEFISDNKFNIFSLTFLLLTLVFQVLNIKKYGLKNGAGLKRILFIVATLTMITHVIRLMFGITQGIFLFLHIVSIMFLFEAIDFKLIWKTVWGWVRLK